MWAKTFWANSFFPYQYWPPRGGIFILKPPILFVDLPWRPLALDLPERPLNVDLPERPLALDLPARN